MSLETPSETRAEADARPGVLQAAQVSHPIPVGNAFVYRLTRVFVLAHFRLGGGCVFGRQNIPRTGRFILAPNHVSHLDPPLVSSCSPRRPHVMAKQELFKNNFAGNFIRALGAFPVDRGKADRRAIRHAIRLLESGAPLLIFPEGTRSKTGNLGPAEIGLGMIAHATKAPIVPVFLRGTDGAFSAMNPRFAVPKIEIHYGAPLEFEEEYSRRGERATLEAIGEKTMAAIAELRDKTRR